MQSIADNHRDFSKLCDFFPAHCCDWEYANLRTSHALRLSMTKFKSIIEMPDSLKMTSVRTALSSLYWRDDNNRFVKDVRLIMRRFALRRRSHEHLSQRSKYIFTHSKHEIKITDFRSSSMGLSDIEIKKIQRKISRSIAN